MTGGIVGKLQAGRIAVYSKSLHRNQRVVFGLSKLLKPGNSVRVVDDGKEVTEEVDEVTACWVAKCGMMSGLRVATATIKTREM